MPAAGAWCGFEASVGPAVQGCTAGFRFLAVHPCIHWLPNHAVQLADGRVVVLLRWGDFYEDLVGRPPEHIPAGVPAMPACPMPYEDLVGRPPERIPAGCACSACLPNACFPNACVNACPAHL